MVSSTLSTRPSATTDHTSYMIQSRRERIPLPDAVTWRSFAVAVC